MIYLCGETTTIAMFTKKIAEFIESIYTEKEYYTREFFFRWYKRVALFLKKLGLNDDEVIGFLRAHPIDIARAYKWCSDLKPEHFAARHWIRYTVPTTEEEAFKMLDEIMPIQEKDFAVQDSKEEFVASEHFGLGLWIRNHWIHRIDTPDEIAHDRYNACYRMLTSTKPEDHILIDPDSISSSFLEKYYDHLKELVATDAPAIGVRRKPAKCPHCGGKVLSIKYGDPGPEMMAVAERGEFLLGGCCIGPDSPDYECIICGQTFIKGIED